MCLFESSPVHASFLLLTQHSSRYSVQRKRGKNGGPSFAGTENMHTWYKLAAKAAKAAKAATCTLYTNYTSLSLRKLGKCWRTIGIFLFFPQNYCMTLWHYVCATIAFKKQEETTISSSKHIVFVIPAFEHNILSVWSNALN